MTKKKNSSSVTPSVSPAPKIVEPTPEEISGLGMRDVERHISNKPTIVGSEGGRNLMAFKNATERETIPQPYLNQAEVEKMGIRGWWNFRGRKDAWTTLINHRRFLLTDEVFQDLKNRGLVLAVGREESKKWNQK